MKLYEVYLYNGLPYEGSHELTMLIVAKNQEKANNRAKELLYSNMSKSLNERASSYNATEISSVDGYKITLQKEK